MVTPTDWREHPPHLNTHSLPGRNGPVEIVDPPRKLPTWWQQFRRERNCRIKGGHWWHSADAMIAWFCCYCGRETDGSPRDGTGGGLFG